jgi:hypothetical protein
MYCISIIAVVMVIGIINPFLEFIIFEYNIYNTEYTLFIISSAAEIIITPITSIWVCAPVCILYMIDCIVLR